MNYVLSEFVGNLFPKALGCPYRCSNFKEYFIADSIEYIEKFIKSNYERDCYITVYPFTEYNQTIRNKHSAIINTIPLDLDDKDNPQNALDEAKIIIDWCKRHDIKFRLYFSGHKGFHIYIDIVPIKLKHSQEVLKKFGYELAKDAGLKTIDQLVLGDLDRIMRLPNTINSKSGLYCIPLNPKLIPYLSIKDIQNMAKNKSDYIPIRCENDGEIRKLLEEYDEIVDKEIEETKLRIERERILEEQSVFPGLMTGIPCVAYRHYMDNGVEYGDHDIVISAIVQKLRSDGYTKDKIYRELCELSKKCTPRLDDVHIRMKINYHFTHQYSMCTFFSKVCPLCVTCYNRKF